jgi:hypothetical protein
MKKRSTIQRMRRRGGLALLLGSLAASMLAGSMTAKGAVVADCAEGELVWMYDPVVTVIDGPGDVAEEQARWSSFALPRLQESRKITLGETTFELERVP